MRIVAGHLGRRIYHYKLEGLPGSENYKDGVQNGDIEERMNSAGKLMDYARKEKVSGKRESIRAGKSVEKATEIKVDDYAKFAASIAMEAKAWCKFGLTGDTGDQRLLM